jgi:SAM-dependent methyltransferase
MNGDHRTSGFQANRLGRLGKLFGWRTTNRYGGDVGCRLEVEQAEVDQFFDHHSEFWQRVYEESTLEAHIYQARQKLVVAFVDSLGLREGARVLEIGAGAGFLTIALAARGHDVYCVDSSAAMVDRSRRNAIRAGFSGRIHPLRGDAHALAFADDVFDLVLAVGVVPWLHSPATGLRQVRRVIRPGGHVILSADNAWRLNNALDPRISPLLARPRRLTGTVLRRAGLMSSAPSTGAVARLDSNRTVNRLLIDCGLHRLRSTTVGFGPFTLMAHPLFSDQTGIKVHQLLQRFADRNVWPLRDAGSHYVVCARRDDQITSPRG